jgi:hypothetical protein
VDLVAHVRGVGEELLRDAADVDAGAAEGAGFGDGDFRAERAGDAARPYAARPTADREKIEIVRQSATSGS